MVPFLFVIGHERTGGEILLDARLPPALTTASVRLVPLDALPALSAPSIEDDFDRIIAREIFREVAQQVRLVSGHDKQVSGHLRIEPYEEPADARTHDDPARRIQGRPPSRRRLTAWRGIAPAPSAGR